MLRVTTRNHATSIHVTYLDPFQNAALLVEADHRVRPQPQLPSSPRGVVLQEAVDHPIELHEPGILAQVSVSLLFFFVFTKPRKCQILRFNTFSKCVYRMKLNGLGCNAFHPCFYHTDPHYTDKKVDGVASQYSRVEIRFSRRDIAANWYCYYCINNPFTADKKNIPHYLQNKRHQKHGYSSKRVERGNKSRMCDLAKLDGHSEKHACLHRKYTVSPVSRVRRETLLGLALDAIYFTRLLKTLICICINGVEPKQRLGGRGGGGVKQSVAKHTHTSVHAYSTAHLHTDSPGHVPRKRALSLRN